MSLCNYCNQTVIRVTDDALDYCQEHGVVEGNTHECEHEHPELLGDSQ